MEIFDVSITLSSDLPVWPGDPKIEIKQISSMDEGDVCNVSHLALGVHAGTHVDAPHHFLNDKRTAESLDLNILTGKAYLVEIDKGVDLLTSEIFGNAHIPAGIERLLIKTRNSEYWMQKESKFINNFVAINQDGANWLVQNRIKLVGVDYLSIAPFGEGVPTHVTMLKAGIIALEGLDLSSVSEGYYELFCLPLKILNSDGAPARVILRK
jgi:arylformamidase